MDLPDGRTVTIAPARRHDALRLRWLYHRVYGGSYPFSLVYNPQECTAAIESDKYLWYLARCGDDAVASLVFNVDRDIRLGKAFGAVVAPEFRGHDLAEKMLEMGLAELVGPDKAVRSVYATTRTVSLAPQRLAEKAGFKKLGIFPNAHKVQRSETHTLAVYYGEGSLEGRSTRPRLPAMLEPFFALVRRETGIPEAEFVDLPVDWKGPEEPLPFEVLQAPQFLQRRLRDMRASRRLALDFFPFHDPNMLLMSPDGRSEIFVYRSAKDGHCVIVGAASDDLDLRTLLEQGASFLEGMGVRYIEALVEASEPERVQHALMARFLPSAYYPAMRWGQGGGRDYIVLSRSLAVLDFRGITLQPAYSRYLREYFRLWRDQNVGRVLPEQ
ncbi:MAG: hypothetical protein HY928_09845 [Elusimicrobia bacterium]|nr:hypothetical protein [Elusimicrobiota bacterium]